MIDSLKTCHSNLAKLIGPGMEPLDVIERVEAHRRFWRPELVRVVLLAESHVYTTAQELTVSLRPNALLPAGTPKGYVRLIYCLGYGEDKLLGPGRLASRNSGTPQFWKIFHSCIHPVQRNEDFAPIQVSRTPLPARLVNKVRLLESMRDRGIWLVDASIAALYLPGHSKPPLDRIGAALTASWDGYVSEEIKAVCPQAVLVIGLGVARVLRGRLDRLGVPWAAVPQPNARLSAQEHFSTFNAYYQVCDDPSATRRFPRYLKSSL